VTDPLLEARLDALEARVDLAIDNRWLQSLPWNVQMRDWDEVWTGLNQSIGIPAQRLKRAIDTLRADLKESPSGEGADGREGPRLTQAWSDYSDIYRRSQDLFGEFLEFIGGLTFREAFRGRPEDNTIFRIADEIVRRCSDETIGGPWQSITVPARDEALRTTLARIIRLRYPEQSLWTLPFTAHEYGHVAMEIKETGFPEFVREQAAAWMKSRPRLRKSRGTSRIAEVSAAELHAAELAADAFATYYMGLAYGCSAIHLKLEFLTSEDGPSQSATGSMRGFVILKVLELMNDTGVGGKYPGLRDNLELLTADWERAATAAGGGGLDTGDRDRLEAFANAIHGELFRYELSLLAQYPSRGWTAALNWGQQWEEELTSEGELTAPKEALTERPTDLRDVLNAAWITRLSLEGDPILIRVSSQRIQRAALELCERIIEKQREGKTTKTVPRPGG
jgi:hypothetical protein